MTKRYTPFVVIILAMCQWAAGGIIVNITDDGTDLTMRATGTYDLTQATQNNSSNWDLQVNAAVAPAARDGIFGWNGGPGAQGFTVTFSGSLTGTDNAFPATTVNTSTPFWVTTDINLFALKNGAALTGTVDETAIFQGVTLSSLGMVEGEVMTASWTGDSATFRTDAIPEPATLAFIGLFGGGLLFVRRVFII